MTDAKPCCHDYYSVCDVLQRKAIQGIESTGPRTSLRDAAAHMLSAGVGALLVIEDQKLKGIVTERDVVRMVRDADDAAAQLVHQAMNRDVCCCSDDVSVDEVAELMRVRRIRHIPVVNANEDVVGVVSIGDINAHRVGQCEVVLNHLENYVYRRA
jgi:CBS domain-containing protein